MTTALLQALAIVLIAGGLAGMVLPAVPGPALLFAGFLVGAWAEDFRYIGIESMSVLGVLAVLAYIADFVDGSLGASCYGASLRAAIRAAGGAVVARSEEHSSEPQSRDTPI